MKRITLIYKKHPFLYTVLIVLLILIPTLFLIREKTGIVSQRIAQTATCDSQTIACDLQFQENKSSACGAFQSLAVDNLITRDDSPCKGMDRAVVERVLQEACTNGCVAVTTTPIVTGEPTQVPSSTASSSPTTVPTLTPTIHNTSTPTVTHILAPTLGQDVGNSAIQGSFKFPGIGSGLAENTNPIPRNRVVYITLKNASGVVIDFTAIDAIFEGDIFKGSIDLNRQGKYFAVIETPGSLPITFDEELELVSDFVTVIETQIFTPGDIDGNKKLDIFDFNKLISECYLKETCLYTTPTADLNSDGVVDSKDLNILLRSFALRND